jgi:hypothetical protein
MLSSEGGDLGLTESGASISLISEGVLGLLALLSFLDGPRDGLHLVENAFRKGSMLYSTGGQRERLCVRTRALVIKGVTHVWLLTDSRKEDERRLCDNRPCRVPNVSNCSNKTYGLRTSIRLECSFCRPCSRPTMQV